MIESFVVPHPWSLTAVDGPVAAPGRPSLLTQTNIIRVDVTGTDISLPQLNRVTTHDGSAWIRWELPGTGQGTEGEETLGLTLGDRHGRRAHECVQLVGDLAPGSSHETALHGPVEPVQSFLGRHVEVINRMCGSDGQAGQPMAEGCAVVDRTEFLKNCRESDHTTEPRLALIVRIAQLVGDLVEDVGCRPRRALRRTRLPARVECARQLDAACLRWLVRQPGNTLSQRAGPRQRVLSVVREEVVDTIENRVVRDFLDRAMRECDSYLAEHRRQQRSFRWRLVQRFRGRCQWLRGAGPLAEIAPAKELVQPTYALQHDQRYSPIWTWYLRLRRKQQEQDRIWRWKQRTAAEATLFALDSALESLESTLGHPDLRLRGRVYLRQEQSAGTFLDPRSEIVPRLLSRKANLFHFTLVPAARLDALRQSVDLPLSLAGLGPDAVGILHEPCRLDRPKRVFAFWCHIASGSHADPDEICDQLTSCRSGIRTDGVLLQTATSQEGQVAWSARSSRDGRKIGFQVLKVPFDFDRASTFLRERMRRSLEVS